MQYDPEMRLSDALKLYFSEAGFDERVYIQPRFEVNLGRWIISLPNPKARRDAIRFHDVNHVLTGYKTDFFGETEIGAFELGAGVPLKFIAAWFFNCNSFFWGMILQPRKTLAGFLKGMGTQYVWDSPLADIYVSMSTYRWIDMDHPACLDFPVQWYKSLARIDEPPARLKLRYIPQMLGYFVAGALLNIPIGLGLAWSFLTTRRKNPSHN